MAEKPLDGLLIVISNHTLPQWDANELRNLGAVVIVKRPHTEVEVKRLATGEPLEMALDIMDNETWTRLVELRERLVSTGADASVHVLTIP